MKSKHILVRLMAAAITAAALMGCQSSQPTTVGLYKSDNEPMEPPNAADPAFGLSTPVASNAPPLVH